MGTMSRLDHCRQIQGPHPPAGTVSKGLVLPKVTCCTASTTNLYPACSQRVERSHDVEFLASKTQRRWTKNVMQSCAISFLVWKRCHSQNVEKKTSEHKPCCSLDYADSFRHCKSDDRQQAPDIHKRPLALQMLFGGPPASSLSTSHRHHQT